MYEAAVVARPQPDVNEDGQLLHEFFHIDTKHWLLKQRAEI